MVYRSGHWIGCIQIRDWLPVVCVIKMVRLDRCHMM